MADEPKVEEPKVEVPIPPARPKPPAKEPYKEAERFYTPAEIAKEFHYSIAWINRLLRDGHLKAVKPSGSRWRIPTSEVERMRKESIRLLAKTRKPIPSTDIDVPEEKLEKVAGKQKGKLPEAKEEGKKEREKLGWPFNLIFSDSDKEGE